MSRLAALRATAAANVEVDPTIELPTATNDRDVLVARTGLKTANKFQIDIFQHLNDQLVAYSEGRPAQGGAVEAVAGSGKCLGINTPVLMYDGSIKPVQDVVIGDTLMGPDSCPRLVVSTNIGFGELFRIDPTKGDSFVCNDVHVMTLAGTNRKMGQIKDIALDRHLTDTRHHGRPDRDWKLFRTGVEFSAQPTDIPPYLMGVWVGDGTIDAPVITTKDHEIVDYCQSVAQQYDATAVVMDYANDGVYSVRFRIGDRGVVGRNSVHHIARAFQQANVDGVKRIPINYLRNSVEKRLELLAGLMDSDGYNAGGYAEIVTKYAELADDIAYLCRSLGLAAYIRPVTKTIKSLSFSGNYFQITISGDLSVVPAKLSRRMFQPRQQIKRTSVTGWTATPLGCGDYYGFTLDNDGRFLLGDFTVTHNTTTIVAASRLIPTHFSAIFLAFNKAIAEELGERLPKNVEAKTLNSLGFRYVRPYLAGLGVRDVKLNGSRTRAIIRKEMTFEQNDQYGKDVVFLVNMCKSMGVAPLGVNDAVGVNGQTATDDVLTNICFHHGRMIDIVVRPTVYAAVRKILAMSFDDANIYSTNTIDYDDQKWLTVCKRPFGRPMAVPTYDVVIIDEVQDVNSVDIEMIRMVLKPGGIVIGVGDSKQAIYGFRGADTSAFAAFTSAFNAKTLPLSITYRCSKNIVKHAQELVPSIQAAPNAIDGPEVETIGSYDAKFFQPKDMVLCRNNAPLVEFAYKLIQAGVPVFVKGRDIGANLIRIIETCVVEKIWVPNPKVPGKKMPEFSVANVTTQTLVRELGKWRATQIDLIKIENPDDDAAVQRIDDQYNSVMVFAMANKDNRVSTLVVEIEAMFSDEAREDAVVCATIHKSKGLEADRVFMHRVDCMYPFYVTPGTWQYDQEKNLDYVARTRGKTVYAYLAKDGWQ
jgi:hypothetical protein